MCCGPPITASLWAQPPSPSHHGGLWLQAPGQGMSHGVAWPHPSPALASLARGPGRVRAVVPATGTPPLSGASGPGKRGPLSPQKDCCPTHSLCRAPLEAEELASDGQEGSPRLQLGGQASPPADPASTRGCEVSCVESLTPWKGGWSRATVWGDGVVETPSWGAQTQA